VTGAPQDRAASLVHDVGVHIVRGPAETWDSRSSRAAVLADAHHRSKWCASFCRASIYCLSGKRYCVSTTSRDGRDNIHKARIKILVKSLGIGEFRRRVEAEWESIRGEAPRVDEAEVAACRSFFNPPAYRNLVNADPAAGKERRFELVPLQHAEQQGAGYRAVYVSLKKPDVAPG